MTETEEFLTARTFSATVYSMKNASLYLVCVCVHMCMGKYPTTCVWWLEHSLLPHACSRIKLGWSDFGPRVFIQ